MLHVIEHTKIAGAPRRSGKKMNEAHSDRALRSTGQCSSLAPRRRQRSRHTCWKRSGPWRDTSMEAQKPVRRPATTGASSMRIRTAGRWRRSSCGPDNRHTRTTTAAGAVRRRSRASSRTRRFVHDASGNPVLISERLPPGSGYVFDIEDIHQPVGADPWRVTVALHFLVQEGRVEGSRL